MAIKLNITYNGSNIAEVTNGQTATIACKDKKMLSDLVFEAVAVESETTQPYFTLRNPNTLATLNFTFTEGQMWDEYYNYQATPTQEMPFYGGGENNPVYYAGNVSLDGTYVGSGIRILGVLGFDTIITGGIYDLEVSAQGGGAN